MKNNTCIFVISNGRPNNIKTIETLHKSGCTIPVYIVIDNEDKHGQQYIDKYKESVRVFDKKAYAKKVDNFDNLENYRSTTHARNACFDICSDLGYQHFIVLDDDYTAFKLRITNELIHPDSCPNLKDGIDQIFLRTMQYYLSTNATSICYSQGGDWFGGETQFNKKVKRKAMNSFFCTLSRRFWFVSRLNEDVNTYMQLGKSGDIFFTIPFVQLDQVQTQKSSGGMSDAYKAGGTYIKSFYTVMCRPDCTVVAQMGRTDRRFHHRIDWSVAVPVIIDEKHQKQ